ncbi:ABC transporter ATP-binding protein [Nitrincola iocasae]|uniref:ABC transporter ATP-binding protein n=1 Tax=Nitrincola iocasae TaxID=2614693 RepID=A0A5J6LFC9_9GAMM|nr:ABC transporter ATP-binding protein [Nitrincola iocasae]QEW07340.1 ABC transporter ATP-binding protein [Nitrincola iocasae]
MLTATGLCKTYNTPQGPLQVFSNLNLTLLQGESLALMGESGCGKSTLLQLLAGLEQADAGSIQLAGQQLLQLNDHQRALFRRQHLGIVFQQLNLIPSLNVKDNLAFQARIAGNHDLTWQQTLIQRLELGRLTDRYPHQLSGGQQQRVAIGRALAVKPAVILADEPTGSLDERTGDVVMTLFLELVRDSGASLLMVTHSNRLAGLLDRRLTLHNGQLQ